MSENKYSKKGKEEYTVDLRFASIIDRFHQVLFTVNHDDPKVPNVDIFSIFNRAWVDFATEWNKQAKKVLVDPKAFENYAINQDI